MKNTLLIGIAFGCAVSTNPSWAAVQLLATGTLNAPSDLSGLTGNLENDLAAYTLGGLGSGLAWEGGSRFLALPDRGPNATAYAGGVAVDNTTSYVARFHSITMNMTANPVASTSGVTPFVLTPTLTATTLLSSPTALNYGSTPGLPSAVPTSNTPGRNFFTGRSDGFASGLSTNPANARLDPEGIRVSNDGRSIFVSDEYGPYVRQFDRQTGALIRSFALPNNFAVTNQNAVGATEISGNAVGRVANKGMEGLAITPNGKTLVGLMQSPLAQDGGDGGQFNRIVTIDIATGQTRQFAFNNAIANKNYNSSEIIAVSATKFIVLERDGKGLGDGSAAAVKQLRIIDIAGAAEVSAVTGAATLAPLAINPSLFLDFKAFLNSIGVADTQVPAKIEALAFGDDVVVNGQIVHTLWIANDNDFVPTVAGPNTFWVFGFTDADLPGYTKQQLANVPLPGTLALAGLGLVFIARQRKLKAKVI
jgi:hypothetical protein